jgi:hypothetical protein
MPVGNSNTRILTQQPQPLKNGFHTLGKSSEYKLFTLHKSINSM